MHGNVFQVHGEPRKRGEFKRTMAALERYAGRFYPLDTVLLQPLFKDLLEPKISPPKTPSEKKSKKDGVKVEGESVPEDPSEGEKIMYIEGSQCTVLWYVDDSKVSHKSEKVVTEVITELEKEFGEMVTTRGKKHNFVGMDILFKSDGSVKIAMKNIHRNA